MSINVLNTPSEETFIRVAEALEKQVQINEIVDRSGSPGGDKLIAGDTNAGFLGFVSSDELITGSDLCTAIGLSAGTLINSNTPWIKYIWKGAIGFIPVKPIRHSATWNAIYNAGAVYGTGDEGLLPPNGRLGVDLTIDANDNSINTTTQNFLAGTDSSDDVGTVGDTLILKGWSNSANNGSFTIDSITNEKIVLSGGSLVTESGGKTKRLYNNANTVTQDATVSIGEVGSELTYSVLLPTGAGDDPTDSYSDSDRGGIGLDNFWNWIIGQLHEQAKLKDWAYPQYMDSDLGNFGIYLTDKDLVTHLDFGNGSYTWCQEVRDTSSWRRVLRGHLGASFLSAAHSWSAFSFRGFRPRLELSRTATL